jgi:signal transduction histidine kinase
VLVNLGSNGIKFTPSGEVAFRVQVAAADLVNVPVEAAKAGAEVIMSGEHRADSVQSFGAQGWQPPDQDAVYLHFEVQDTGIGIPAGGHERLFQSFSQVDSSTTRKFGGACANFPIRSRF